MSHTTSLSDIPLTVKRYAAIPALRQAIRVTTTRKWEPKSDLQRVFLRRVKAEMEVQGLSENELARRVGGPKQKTLNDVMRGRDPRLKTVEQIAKALGVMPPWKLLKEDEPTAAQPPIPTERKVFIGGTISHFPPSKTGHRGKAAKIKKG